MNNATISKPAQYMLNAIYDASVSGNTVTVTDNNPVADELIVNGLIVVNGNSITLTNDAFEYIQF